ncbi:PTI1-like tyrosine-protein kinase [Camellia lanceoleosa]|uniref:PTI1-like tyrosine-protein kinase n=1 Tax=Camellia lanceoleosa TaxID=1840588 RepID=A0ACC0I8U3_9ERIC|nr:PTI1-like tyrosine-protein kinase [Camellia lanceoleosa]
MENYADVHPRHPWQNILLEYLSSDPNHRSIYWIYDPDGGEGKTEFSKVLEAKYDYFVVKPTKIENMILSSRSSLHSYSLSSSPYSLSRVSDSVLRWCHSNNDDSASASPSDKSSSVNRWWDSVIQEVLRNAVKKFDLSLFGGFPSLSLSPESSVRKGQGKKHPTWTIFSLKELHAATNNFNYDNKLREGGFGSVH